MADDADELHASADVLLLPLAPQAIQGDPGALPLVAAQQGQISGGTPV
jgi:hypothetical protein